MTNQFLQCLHQSKLLLMYAKKSDWESFEVLHPIWSLQIDACLSETNESKSQKMAKPLQSLIEDVDEIQLYIKGQMSKIEADFSASLQSNKAVQTYLK